MRIICLCLMIICSAPFAGAATESNSDSFEKSFQNLGKKLDQAKAKGVEVGEDAKREWRELKAKTEQAAADTKEKRNDWSERLKGAVTELGAGLNNAWAKLKGEK